MASTAIVLFTRDLRIRDNPTLWRAVHDHDRVVPLFVLDDDILNSDYNRPNRATFLAQSLADLDESLRGLGAGLVIRRGRLEHEVAEVAKAVGADVVHVSLDASGYSANRVKRLRDTVEVVGHDDTLFVVPPGRIKPSGGADHMSVFGAYYRRWEKEDRRPVHGAPRSIEMPRIVRGRLPEPEDICRGTRSPNLAPGGETAGRKRLAAWLKKDAARYADVHDDLAADATSRLSPYLHFGCVSPVELVSRRGVVAEFVRQIAWRDFHAQVLSARPGSTKRDYRHRGDTWHRANEEFEAWKAGRTGLPIVDAGMRQLAEEGWMHNRARLIVGHLLVKTLYIDWRLGAQHFVDLLVDGDTSNNTMNWQWVAGTGTDSRYNRTFSIESQAKRYDPSGDYVRRYVPELRSIDGPAVHRPWKLPDEVRQTLDYPEPIVDVAEGNRRFLAARGA
jgi:deoxyribodipyrimidine photo-lyase